MVLSRLISARDTEILDKKLISISHEDRRRGVDLFILQKAIIFTPSN
jgi:hypothetical protein